MTWGINPGQSVGVDERLPRPQDAPDQERASLEEAYTYMELKPGEPIEGNEGNAIIDPEDRRTAVFPIIDRTRAILERAEEAQETWTMWTDRVLLLKTILPKTGETISLLDRYLVTADELTVLMAEQNGVEIDPDDLPSERGPGAPDPRVQQRLQEEMRSRDVTWILGTSLAFEAVMLALCAVIFVRRDF